MEIMDHECNLLVDTRERVPMFEQSNDSTHRLTKPHSRNGRCVGLRRSKVDDELHSL